MSRLFSLTTACDEHVSLAGRLRPFLPTNYLWLGQEDLTVVGARSIGAGAFADVWLGELGDRRVAVKSYRRWASADCAPIYEVSLDTV